MLSSSSSNHLISEIKYFYSFYSNCLTVCFMSHFYMFQSSEACINWLLFWSMFCFDFARSELLCGGKFKIQKIALWFPPHIMNVGGWCYIFKVFRQYFLRCGHLFRISSLLFNMVSWSAWRIVSFSVRQRSHLFPPLENE